MHKVEKPRSFLKKPCRLAWRRPSPTVETALGVMQKLPAGDTVPGPGPWWCWSVLVPRAVPMPTVTQRIADPHSHWGSGIRKSPLIQCLTFIRDKLYFFLNWETSVRGLEEENLISSISNFYFAISEAWHLFLLVGLSNLLFCVLFLFVILYQRVRVLCISKINSLSQESLMLFMT